MRYLIDSYSWIEYLEGSSKGEVVDKILKGDHELYTLGLIVAEVISRVKRKKGNVDTVYRAITMNSKVVGVDSNIARDAGILHAEMKKKKRDFGLMDAIILTMAKKLNAKVVTGDEHFKELKETIFLK